MHVNFCNNAQTCSGNELPGHRMLFKLYRITVESEPKETV